MSLHCKSNLEVNGQNRFVCDFCVPHSVNYFADFIIIKNFHYFHLQFITFGGEHHLRIVELNPEAILSFIFQSRNLQLSVLFEKFQDTVVKKRRTRNQRNIFVIILYALFKTCTYTYFNAFLKKFGIYYASIKI